MLTRFSRNYRAPIWLQVALLLLAPLPLACGNASERAQAATGGAGVPATGGARTTGGTGAVASSTASSQGIQSMGGTSTSGGATTSSSSGGAGSSSGGTTGASTQQTTGGNAHGTGGNSNTGGTSTAMGASNTGLSFGGNTNSAGTSTGAGGSVALGGTTSFSGGNGAITGGSTSTTTSVSLPGVTARRSPLELTQTDDFPSVSFTEPAQKAQFGANGSSGILISNGRIRVIAQCQSGNCAPTADSTSQACFGLALLPPEQHAQITLTVVDATGVPTGFDWRAAGTTGLTLTYDVRDNGGDPVTGQFAATAAGSSVLWLVEAIGPEMTTHTLELGSLSPATALDTLDIMLTGSAGQVFTFCIDDLVLDPPVQPTDYVPSSELLTDADFVRDYVRDCAEFWSKTQAPNGGFYSDIDRTGAAIDTSQYPLSQWRLTYGFTRAFMLTGDEKYLQLAEVALPLAQPTTGIGVPRATQEWVYDGFEHNYSKVGLMAYCEATRDPSTCARVVVDELPPVSQQTDFNTVVDAFTTHLILLRLVRYDDPIVQAGFQTWAEALLANLAALSSKEEWYVMKLAWTLMRVSLITGDSRFSGAARGLLRPFGSRWAPLGSTGLEWWPMEEFTLAPLLGYMMFGYQPERRAYLRAADGTARDYAEYFIDPQYGEVYLFAGAAGTVDTTKGTQYKSGYHSIEYGYFAYIYSSLFLRHEPFTLFYRFVPSETERDLVLTPIAVGDNQLRIKSVTHAGERYVDFRPSLRSLHLGAEANGVFAVTFEGTDL